MAWNSHPRRPESTGKEVQMLIEFTAATLAVAIVLMVLLAFTLLIFR